MKCSEVIEILGKLAPETISFTDRGARDAKVSVLS